MGSPSFCWRHTAASPCLLATSQTHPPACPPTHPPTRPPTHPPTAGIGISIGKTALYVAGGGFHPEHSLPIVLDVGCNRAELREDKYYLGERRQRLEGEEYHAVIEEFCVAVKKLWPHALLQVGWGGASGEWGWAQCRASCMPRMHAALPCLHHPLSTVCAVAALLSLSSQFEDFSTDKAFEILHRQRDRLLCCERLPLALRLLCRSLRVRSGGLRSHWAGTL
jgi:hypothetical protein